MHPCRVALVRSATRRIWASRSGLYHSFSTSSRLLDDRSQKTRRTETGKRSLSPEEFAELTEFSAGFVDLGSSPKPPNKSWKVFTNPGRENRKLSQAIPVLRSASVGSLEKRAFEAPEPGTGFGGLDGDEGPSESFMPGTFVELRRRVQFAIFLGCSLITLHRNEGMVMCVVLEEIQVAGQRRIVGLTSSGEVLFALKDDVMFAVPGFISPDLAARCSTEATAQNKVQQNARVTVLKKILELANAVEKEASKMNVTGIGRAYQVLSARDPEAWGKTTTPEVARLFGGLSPTISMVTIFAAHRHMMQNPLHFVPELGYIQTKTFILRPRSECALITRVSGWTRQGSDLLKAFATRALAVIDRQRKLSVESWTEPPSQAPGTHTWTSEEVDILRFLQLSLRTRRSTQKDPYTLPQSYILRLLYPEAEVTDDLVHETLVNLGVYAPWQDLMSLRRELGFDPRPPALSPSYQEKEAIVKRSMSLPPAPSGPLGPEDLYKTDPMESFRHDFGDLAVYVMDDANAHELDDGVSYEEVIGKPGSYWVHSHIANPTSTLPHTHILARRAALQLQTMYFNHRTFPLLPTSLVHSSLPGFSLVGGQENRVLTISTRIDKQGSLREVLVRPGIVRNVIKMSYDDADLAVHGVVAQRWYPLSDAPPPAPAMSQVPDKCVQDLRVLGKIRDRMQRRRYNMGLIETESEVSRVDMPEPPSLDMTSPIFEPSEFRGFPKLDYSVHKFSANAFGARAIVGEAMKLACWGVSVWCRDRGIPVLRRASAKMVASPENWEKLYAARDEAGYVDTSTIMALCQLPIGNYSLEPSAHWALGIPATDGYTRATSPLRRFTDLLVHYQVQSHLLGKPLPFSADWIEGQRLFISRDDILKRRSESLHQRFWALMALKRQMLTTSLRRDGPNPLQQLDAVVMNPPIHNNYSGEIDVDVRIPRLGISGQLQDIGTWRMPTTRVGDRFAVKIKQIDLGVRPGLRLSLV
ncbi:unnamed protein product [Mycena citricolor]|uniref:RNB domain-containing protein n=1 Tax=Mycena citricolor TaxID=2018698 RepID=A0AAD2H5V5_9AGAR|nr:unnamed protein product [Mycena citricolor]